MKRRKSPFAVGATKKVPVGDEKDCFILRHSHKSGLVCIYRLVVCASPCTPRPFNSPVGGGGTTKAFSSTSFLGSTTCMLSPADTISSFTASKTE